MFGLEHMIADCHGERTALLMTLSTLPFVGVYIKGWLSRRAKKVG
jgi:hypothetical protein